MKSNRTNKLNLLIGALLSLAPLATQAAPAPSELIASDALGAFWINNLPTLKTSWAETPYGKLLNHPSSAKAKQFVESFVEKAMSSDSMTDKDLEDLKTTLKHTDGGMSVIIYKSADSEEPKVVITFDLSEEGVAWVQSDLIPRLDENMANPEKSSYEVDGVTVYSARDVGATSTVTGEDGTETVVAAGSEEDTQVALVGDLFLITNALGKDALVSTIQLAQGKEGVATLKSSMTTQPNSSRIFDANPSQVGMIIAEGAFDLFKETVLADVEEAAAAAALEASGLFDFRSIAVVAQTEGNDVVVKGTVSTPNGRTGVIGGLTKTGATDLQQIAQVPADVMSFSTFQLDMDAILTAAFAVAEKASPGSSGMVNMFALSSMSNYGVDPIKLIRSISGQHLAYQKPMAEELKADMEPLERATASSLGVLVSLSSPEENSAALKLLLTNLKNDPDMGGNFELEEIDGYTTIRPTETMRIASKMDMCLAITPKGLLIANNQIQLKEMIRIAKGEATTSIMDNQRLQALIAKIDTTNLYSLSFTPTENSTAGIEGFRSYLNTLPLDAANWMTDGESILDPSVTSLGELVPATAAFKDTIGDSWSIVNAPSDAIVMDLVIKSKE